MYECPKCGKDIETDTCECGFNINEIISCPYKVSGNCVHTNKECGVYGMDFEDCEIYLHKSGIEKENK